MDKRPTVPPASTCSPPSTAADAPPPPLASHVRFIKLFLLVVLEEGVGVVGLEEAFDRRRGWERRREEERRGCGGEGVGGVGGEVDEEELGGEFKTFLMLDFYVDHRKKDYKFGFGLTVGE
ncbi:uncharacterized protein A4U43_C03F22760 [Asparagus officinalis]|uniref:Uncharacterized protein n=1 Tax=Asparagus officinalis TaxID=4686 RepID=A0A5P1FF29_ASPOF|nr:uncharacterized protein A4U43_C03F22760 [Asparagus officinalis]